MTRALSGPACVAEDMHPWSVAKTPVNTLSVDPYNYPFAGRWNKWRDEVYCGRRIRHSQQAAALVLP